MSRYRLAFLLASAVLQLHSTPWINDKWDLSDILSPDSQTLQPYLSTQTSLPSSPVPWVQNQLIFTLGLSLLELSFATKLSTLIAPAELDTAGQATPFTEFCAATRLARELDQREVPRYTNAVNRCVRCNFDTNSVDLDDVGFQNLFFENVVVPLRECYEFTL